MQPSKRGNFFHIDSVEPITEGTEISIDTSPRLASLWHKKAVLTLDCLHDIIYTLLLTWQFINTCKKVAFLENILSAITNKGDSEKTKQNNNNNTNNNIRGLPTGFKTKTVVYNGRFSSMARRGDSAGVNWPQIIRTGQHKNSTPICEENIEEIVVRHKSFEYLGLVQNTIVSNLLLCIWWQYRHFHSE